MPSVSKVFCVDRVFCPLIFGKFPRLHVAQKVKSWNGKVPMVLQKMWFHGILGLMVSASTLCLGPGGYVSGAAYALYHFVQTIQT